VFSKSSPRGNVGGGSGLDVGGKYLNLSQTKVGENYRNVAVTFELI
jgi:hypothetical protein